jgi:hypothetical protein
MVVRINIALGILLWFTVATNALAGSFGFGPRAGMHVTPIPGTGADLFYSASKFTLGLSYASGSYDFTSLLASSEDPTTTISISKADVAASLLLLELKYFLFWGCYISAGLGQRTIDMDLEVAESMTDTRIGTKLKTKSSVVNLGMGAMGRWNHVYLSLDIFAYSSPTSSTTSAETTASGLIASNEDLSDLNDDIVETGTDLGNAGSVQLFNFGIGVMF